MADNGLKELEGELMAPVPDGLKALSDDRLSDLAGAVREARHRQAAALSAAAERAYGHLPWLLRGPVRKMFGG